MNLHEHGKESNSSLLSIPEDQWQLVLSFTCLRSLIDLTLVSKDVNAIALKSHHLTTSPLDILNHEHLRTSSLRNSSNGSPPYINSASSGRSLRSSVSHGNNLDSQCDLRLSISDTRPTIMTRLQLKTILYRFRSLRVLKLSNLQRVGEDLIPILNSSHLTFLVHLELRDVRMYTNEHALNLTHSPHEPAHTKLETIVIKGTIFSSYHPVISSFIQSTPNLTLLELDGCRSLVDTNASEISFSLGQNANFRHLSFENNSKLLHPALGPCPHLRSLNLQKCLQLQSLPNFLCPSLLKVNLSFCSMLRQEAVKNIVKVCPHLQELLLIGCKDFKAIEISAPKLQLLDLSMCMGLEYCRIHCQSIETLHLGMCLALKCTHLKLSTIKVLDLSMLPLEELSIQAYDLAELNLSGNFKLTNENIICDCPNLVTADICGTELEWDRFSNLFATSAEGISRKQGARRKVNVLSGGEAHNWLD